jgi:hypothetical protein
LLSHDAAIAGYLLILRAKCERDGFPIQYAIKEERKMVPNLKGIATTFAQIQHDLETQASGVLSDLQTEAAAANTELARSKKNIGVLKTTVADMKAFNDSIEGSNGGPTLAGSSTASAPVPASSQGAALPEPQASWSGNKPA